MTVKNFAPAKINLALHVTGQRVDGLHLLDSLVVFAALGDEISVENAEETSLSIDGPFASDVPIGPDNLVLRALKLFSPNRHVKIDLKKNLPVASGIGGGSADAAATLRAIADLWDVDIPDADAVLDLGADVPVCLVGMSTIMGGIGEILTPVDVPKLRLVLVNCGVAVNTGDIFDRLPNRTNPPMSKPGTLPNDPISFCEWLGDQRNDLEIPARELAPGISESLNVISAMDECLLARMSGSGATCFGIFPTAVGATNAAKSISRHHPNWWVQATSTLS